MPLGRSAPAPVAAAPVFGLAASEGVAAKASAVEFLLHPPVGVGDESFHLGLVDRVEQLGQDAGGAIGLVGLLVRGAVLAGGVPLGGLLLHQFVVDLPGGGVVDG